MAQALVVIGIAANVLSAPLQQAILSIGGLALSIVGLVWFHLRQKHPARYAVLAVLITVLLPMVGAMIGLAIRPKNKPSVNDKLSYQSMRLLGILLTTSSIVFAILPTYKLPDSLCQIIEVALMCSGFFLWLAGFGAREGWKYCPLAPLTAAIATFLFMFSGCRLSVANIN